MNKPLFLSVVLSGLIIVSAFWLASTRPTAGGTNDSSTAISYNNGVQVIDITAKGGYTPRKVVAKANTQTLLRVQTIDTFDCSASLVIPKLSYQKFLRPSEVVEIAISPDEARGVYQGLCSMGMYNFQIVFK